MGMEMSRMNATQVMQSMMPKDGCFSCRLEFQPAESMKTTKLQTRLVHQWLLSLVGRLLSPALVFVIRTFDRFSSQ